jgi:inner membrane protein
MIGTSMPSPVGHALGGIAAGWRLMPPRARRSAAVLAAIAIAPDVDLLVGTHRGASHSVGAAVLAGVAAAVSWAVCARPPLRHDALRVGVAAALAWGSHVLLDWLSNDTRPPIGIMAFWPFTHDYYKASIEIFPPVSRRYWESRFWLYNLRAVAAELLILGPLAWLVLSRRRRAR